MSADATASLVSEILADDPLTRLFALLQYLSAAETNTRSLGLMLLGLRVKVEGLQSNRDLAAAIYLTDSVATRYAHAADAICNAINQRQAQPVQPAAVVLH